jgi:antitoxin (DNA-binding transcriptional repressor) of toxin-antitoxin stability system
MTITIDLEHEKRPLGELVEQTLGGADIVITRNDRPVAKLVAIQPRMPRRFGSARGLIEIAEDFDEALTEGIPLLSDDEVLDAYGLERSW